MADRHTLHTDADGTLLRRHHASYWPTTPDGEGSPDDGEEWQRGAFIDFEVGYGWTAELVAALLVDVIEREREDTAPGEERAGLLPARDYARCALVALSVRTPAGTSGDNARNDR